MDGFHTQEAADVYVQLGEDASLRFQLQLDSITETLVVVGESTPLINPGRTGAASNVTTDALEQARAGDGSVAGDGGDSAGARNRG